MKIGVVAEIKEQENRVALTPAGAADLVQAGHEVLVQAAAGRGAGFDDDTYDHAGAELTGIRTENGYEPWLDLAAAGRDCIGLRPIG